MDDDLNRSLTTSDFAKDFFKPGMRHWFSDVVFGSAVGIISGRTVTRHGKEFPVTVTAMQGGGAVIYVHYWQ